MTGPQSTDHGGLCPLGPSPRIPVNWVTGKALRHLTPYCRTFPEWPRVPVPWVPRVPLPRRRTRRCGGRTRRRRQHHHRGPGQGASPPPCRRLVVGVVAGPGTEGRRPSFLCRHGRSQALTRPFPRRAGTPDSRRGRTGCYYGLDAPPNGLSVHPRVNTRVVKKYSASAWRGTWGIGRPRLTRKRSVVQIF